MANYRFEAVQDELDILEGKHRETISSWTGVTDPTYGDCYRASVTHNFGANSNNVTCYSQSTSEIIQPLAVRDIDNNSLYIFMPINTLNVEVVVN